MISAEMNGSHVDATSDPRIKSVVILGGGTAGWMTASYLAKYLQGTVKITLIEAPSVPKIGVGEATVPNLQRVLFDFLGLKEEDWMRECNASYKTAVRFINWRTPGPGEAQPRTIDGRGDYFHHPFGLLPECDSIPLSHYWNLKRSTGETDEPFDYACFIEPPFMDAKLAPCTLDGKPVTRYAWHFDAHLVADFLRRFSTATLGVVHVQDEYESVTTDDRGFLTSLRCKSGRSFEADLFVDCSGFRGLLINKAMAEPFLDMSDHLLNDSAVASPVPHDDATYGVEPYTSSIAMEAGWTWKIPLLSRFGTGYVYSSKFSSKDKATEDFARLWNLDPDRTDFNHIRFRVGRNRRAWVKNVVSIGLASCFVEPLESTGIYFIYAAAYQLAKHFPDKHFDEAIVDSFNYEIATMFDDTRDFLQAHFAFSPRNDTPFWRANKELKLADQIQEKVRMYKAGMAINQPSVSEEGYYGNFDAEFHNFWTNGSYYCIFAGLGMVPDRPFPSLQYKSRSVREAEHVFDDVKVRQQRLLDTLPTTYERLCHLHGREPAGTATR